jgi:hypothetical protein
VTHSGTAPEPTEKDDSEDPFVPEFLEPGEQEHEPIQTTVVTKELVQQIAPSDERANAAAPSVQGDDEDDEDVLNFEWWKSKVIVHQGGTYHHTLDQTQNFKRNTQIAFLMCRCSYLLLALSLWKR